MNIMRYQIFYFEGNYAFICQERGGFFTLFPYSFFQGEKIYIFLLSRNANIISGWVASIHDKTFFFSFLTFKMCTHVIHNIIMF